MKDTEGVEQGRKHREDEWRVHECRQVSTWHMKGVEPHAPGSDTQPGATDDAFQKARATCTQCSVVTRAVDKVERSLSDLFSSAFDLVQRSAVAMSGRECDATCTCKVVRPSPYAAVAVCAVGLLTERLLETALWRLWYAPVCRRVAAVTPLLRSAVLARIVSQRCSAICSCRVVSRKQAGTLARKLCNAERPNDSLTSKEHLKPPRPIGISRPSYKTLHHTQSASPPLTSPLPHQYLLNAWPRFPTLTIPNMLPACLPIPLFPLFKQTVHLQISATIETIGIQTRFKLRPPSQ